MGLEQGLAKRCSISKFWMVRDAQIYACDVGELVYIQFGELVQSECPDPCKIPGDLLR